MQVRRLTPEEAIEGNKIQTLAFLDKRDYTNQEENLKRVADHYSEMTGAFDDSGKLTAVIRTIPYTVRYHGHDVNMAGIAGVASLPESRRQGNVRALLNAMFKEALEHGQLFSYLYPFSNPYYRQFGYEIALRMIRMKLPMKALKDFPRGGTLEMLPQKGDYADCREVYNRMIRHRNLAVVRSDENWRRRLDFDAYNSHRYAYLYRDSAGQPGGYAFWRHVEKGNDEYMYLSDIAWTEGNLPGLLGSLYTWSAQYDHIEMRVAQEDSALLHLFPEPQDISGTWGVSGMNRVIDVKTALQLYPWHQAASTGRVILRVLDDTLPHNQGNWAVSWEDANVLIKQVGDGPHLTIPVTHLSQILTGSFSLGELLLLPQVRLEGQRQLLIDLFPRRPCFMADDF